MTLTQPLKEPVFHTLPRTAADRIATPPRTLTCVISSRLRPGDRQALLGLFEHSTPQTRRDRFHHALSVFPQGYLDDLMAGRQFAVVARDTCHPASRGKVFGLASAAPTSGSAAEFAVWVDDAWQGHGVGTLLARAVLRQAAEQGTAVAIGIMEPGNLAVRRLLSKIAPNAVYRPQDSMVVVSIALADWLAGQDTTAGAAQDGALK